MTEKAFQKKLDWLVEESRAAVDVYDAQEELYRLAQRTYIVSAMQADYSFWRVHRAALQHTLFVVLGRLFDNSGDAHSIAKVLEAARDYPGFFSREALARRKTALGVTGQLLEEYLRCVWVPDRQVFANLLAELRSRQTRIQQVYLPIRNTYIAHRSLSPKRSVDDLFAQTNRDELGSLLIFIRDLAGTLLEAFINGREPLLGTIKYESSRNEIRSGIRSVFQKLILCQIALQREIGPTAIPAQP